MADESIVIEIALRFMLCQINKLRMLKPPKKCLSIEALDRAARA